VTTSDLQNFSAGRCVPKLFYSALPFRGTRGVNLDESPFTRSVYTFMSKIFEWLEHVSVCRKVKEISDRTH